MQDLDDWINELRYSNKLVILEGKKDKNALVNLGVNNIKILDKPLFRIIEEVSDSYDECILLVDLDKEGRKLYSKLKKGLEKRRVKVDNRFREFLFRKTRLRNIEGINTYIKNHSFLNNLSNFSLHLFSL